MSNNSLTGLKASIAKDIVSMDLSMPDKNVLLKYTLEMANLAFSMGKNHALSEVMKMVGSLTEG